MCTHACTHVHIHTHVHLHTHACTRMHTRMHTHTHTHMHAHTHAHACTYTKKVKNKLGRSRQMIRTTIFFYYLEAGIFECIFLFICILYRTTCTIRIFENILKHTLRSVGNVKLQMVNFWTNLLKKSFKYMHNILL